VLKLVEEKRNQPALTARDTAAASALGALNLTGLQAFTDPGPCPNPA
jgi:hypothetical protein